MTVIFVGYLIFVFLWYRALKRANRLEHELALERLKTRRIESLKFP